MGKRIRTQRKGKSPNYNSNRKGRKGPAKLRPLDSIERNGFIAGKLISILHDRGRGVPLAKIQFQRPKNPLTGLKQKKETITVVCVEGLSENQILYFGAKANLSIGNCLPLRRLPEGTIISSVEFRPGDRSKLAKQSGNYATIVGHDTDSLKTRIKLPSGVKKTLDWNCRAIIGLPAAGGRTEKPLTKAGNSFYKTKSKHKNWPVVRGVAMNVVEHPYGGGNHQHIGKASTTSRNAPSGRKVGLIGARRTGRARGSKVLKTE